MRILPRNRLRLMLEVAFDEDVGDVEMFGFMAENATTSWNIVRDVFFFGGGADTKPREGEIGCISFFPVIAETYH